MAIVWKLLYYRKNYLTLKMNGKNFWWIQSEGCKPAMESWSIYLFDEAQVLSKEIFNIIKKWKHKVYIV